MSNLNVLVTDPRAASAACATAWRATATTSSCTAARGAMKRSRSPTPCARSASSARAELRRGRPCRQQRRPAGRHRGARLLLRRGLQRRAGARCRVPGHERRGMGRGGAHQPDAFYNVLNPVVMPMVQRRAPGRIVTLSSVSGLVGNRGRQLQRGQGRHHRRHQGARDRTGQARHHRQLRGAGADRYRHGRSARTRGGAEDDPGAPPRHARRSRGRGGLPDVAGRGLHHPPVISVNGGMIG